MKPGDMVRTKSPPQYAFGYNVYNTNESGDLIKVNGIIRGDELGIITNLSDEFSQVFFFNGLIGSINMRHLEEVER